MKDGAGRRRVAIIILIPFLLLAALLLYSNIAVTYSRYEKESAKLPDVFDGFKILLISDLHNRSFGRDNSMLIGMIDLEKPDVILIAGDMVSAKNYDFSVFYSLARNLGERYETYYIYGNHEERFEESVLRELEETVSGYGVRIINNGRVRIERDGEGINLYGLTLPMYMYSGVDENGVITYGLSLEDMREILGDGPEEGEFNMLLAHTPLYFEQYAEWGADIVFSGHIHGGLIRIPFIGGVFSPHNMLFPKYDAGEFEIGDSTLILSRGLGEHIAPIRLFNPGDLCVITLTKGEEAQRAQDAQE